MDYCTSFPEGWWAHCCQAHDLAYTNQVARAIADQQLWQCVSTSGHGLGLLSLVVGAAMFIGVRVFGAYYYRKGATHAN